MALRRQNEPTGKRGIQRSWPCPAALILWMTLLCLILFASPAKAQQPPSSVGAAQGTAAPVHPGSGLSSSQNANANPAYTLPKDELDKATRLAHGRTAIYFGSALWGVAFIWLILSLGWVAAWRDRAAAATSRPWLQGLVFLPVLLLTVSLSDLPFSAAGHHLSLEYGQSIQPWGSWLWDWTKAAALTVAGGTLALALLFAVIRRSERKWWLWSWLIAMPLQVAVVFLIPYVVDPLFDDFEPLAQSNLALVGQLERVVARSDLRIPPSRMFLMKASEKYTVLNAYVTGFGASKRIVVWDTTIRKCPPDEILFIYGHEQGHYALNHIRDGMVLSAAGSFFALWLGFHAVRWTVGRYGSAWKVPAVGDWASAGVFLLVFAVFGFFGEPVDNAISRVVEHHADIYGQEVIHGLVADPQRTAQQAFQRLGESSLDDPSPNPFVEFWTYSHPSIGHRAAFAARYNPWAEGQKPRYFPPDNSH